MPFPYVEREREQARPVLIVSAPVGPESSLIWGLMITSAKRGPWPGDIAIPDHERSGLHVPCFVRTSKISTLPVAGIEGRLGVLGADLLEAIQSSLRAQMHL